MNKVIISISFFLILFFGVSTFCSQNRFEPSQLKDGDIIFQETRSSQARAIKLATDSRYTHVGIVFKMKQKYYILEAVQPVRITGLEPFLKRSVNRHFVVKRLRNRNSLLTPGIVARMKKIGKSYLGRNYDPYFEWTDARIYCTELVWKIYKRALGIEIGKLQRLREFDLTHPFVRNLLRKRYGTRIPLDEKVLSPDSMFKAESLVTVFSVN